MYCNSYMQQNLCVRCSLNFEFSTYDVRKCSFILFNINKVTQHGQKTSELSSINLNFMTTISSNSSSLHLETTCPLQHLLLNFLFIKYWRNPEKISKCIIQTQWTIHSIPEKKHLGYYFDITQLKYLQFNGSPTH